MNEPETSRSYVPSVATCPQYVGLLALTSRCSMVLERIMTSFFYTSTLAKLLLFTLALHFLRLLIGEGYESGRML
jgi:hypothetical protein